MLGLASQVQAEKTFKRFEEPVTIPRPDTRQHFREHYLRIVALDEQGDVMRCNCVLGKKVVVDIAFPNKDPRGEPIASRQELETKG